MVNLEYANAYSEVLEILKYISQEDYNKIPKEKINLFEENANKEHDFIYDLNKTLDEQNVSKITKTIIAILFRDYWATDIQREKIKAKELYDRRIKEEQNREIYNHDNIFKKDEKIENKNITAEERQLIPYRESFIKKLFNKIRSFFKFCKK